MSRMTVYPNSDGSKIVRIEGIDNPIAFGAPATRLAALGMQPEIQGPTAVDYLAAALAG